MAETKWEGYFGYKAKHRDIDSVLRGNFIPVSYFAVKGGAKRVIDLTATDDLGLVSEFEQARSFKNIALYIPPTSNFEWLDLTEISIHHLQFMMVFFAQGKIGQTITHEFMLVCKTAEITEAPGKFTSGDRGTVLKVSMALPETTLTHSSPQGDELVREDW